MRRLETRRPARSDRSRAARWAIVPLALLLPPPAGRAAGPGAAAPAAGVAAPAEAAGAVDYAAAREAIFDAFYRTGIDTSAPLAVTNLVLQRDSMTITLRQGTLFLMQPFAGEVTGAAFLGDGEAVMTPPNRTERYMLKKHSGAETLKMPFTEAVLRFTDGTAAEIRAAARPDPAGAARAARAEAIVRERNGWLDGTRELHLEMQFLEARLSRLEGQDVFVADLNTPKHDWLLYVFNPQEIEEHALQHSETMGAVGRRMMVPWTLWHKRADYAPSGHYVLLPDRDGPRFLAIRHRELVFNLRNTKTVEIDALTRVEPLVEGLRALRFDLANNADHDSRWFDDSFYPVRVQSVHDEAGAALPYLHRKDQLLVLLPAAARAGQPLTLRVRASAEVIYQVTPESFGLLQAPSFPQYGYSGGRAPFRWTIKVPRPFTVTGSGRTVRTFTDPETDQNGIELASDIPVTRPWMIFGKFRQSDAAHLSEETKKSIGLSVMTASIGGEGTPAKKAKDFLIESQDILRLFENIYGPYPYEELHIAQMGPGLGFGQGPPYFVQLTGELFQAGASALGQYSVHDFLSHEIAHQWWGNQIGWASDEDEWLSEGFASYAAAIFIHGLQKEAGRKRLLDEWRRDAALGDKEAPVAAANTLRGPNSGTWRQSLLYAKAPYVLHMLRVQLDDAKYREVMRAVQTTYRHRDITTAMLLREVNRVTASDYTFFFDQWVWDVGIPTFRYSWRSDRQPDGKFLVTVHVSQEDKTRVKKVLMPVHLHFKDQTVPQYKPVVQAEQDIKLLSPVEPKDVTLDDDRTLLAEIVRAS